MKILAEHEAKKLLMEYGIPSTTFELLEKMDDIESFEINYPVVLKVSSPKIMHKTDIGAIILDLKNKEELIEQYKKLREKFPYEPFILEEMEKRGIEIIAGIVDDRSFGKCIMVGMGGIFTEIYRDTSFRALPIKKSDAEDMLKSLRGSNVFYGYRLNIDRYALIDLLLKLSSINDKIDIKQLDLNPIFLYETGLKIIDVKIILRE